MQQQAALMAAASQGTYINPMAALATQMPHAAAPLANGITSPVVPPTSGEHSPLTLILVLLVMLVDVHWSFKCPVIHNGPRDGLY